MAARSDEAFQRFMRRALQLAERGRGRVNPNPVVGAVVVQGGRVVGEGWHAALGEAHAEARALEQAGRRARGATMVVTLEPCAHTGRTPPCVDALIAAGIRRCVVGLRDPNPIVNGRGLSRLRAAGIDVGIGALGEEVRRQLAGYLLTHTHARPRVTLKLAASLDGRITIPEPRGRLQRGAWITGPQARRWVHRLRARSDAVVIGAGTALADDPRLTARGVGARRQPLRVVCDTRLRLPRTLGLYRHGRGTVAACAEGVPPARQRLLASLGVDVWPLRIGRDGVAPLALLRRLARAGCHEVLLEGGAGMATSWLRAGLVDRIALFTSPRVLGAGGLSWCDALPRARSGHVVEHRKLGGDLFCMIELGE